MVRELEIIENIPDLTLRDVTRALHPRPLVSFWMTVSTTGPSNEETVWTRMIEIMATSGAAINSCHSGTLFTSAYLAERYWEHDRQTLVYIYFSGMGALRHF